MHSAISYERKEPSRFPLFQHCIFIVRINKNKILEIDVDFGGKFTFLSVYERRAPVMWPNKPRMYALRTVFFSVVVC